MKIARTIENALLSITVMCCVLAGMCMAMELYDYFQAFCIMAAVYSAAFGVTQHCLFLHKINHANFSQSRKKCAPEKRNNDAE